MGDFLTVNMADIASKPDGMETTLTTNATTLTTAATRAKKASTLDDSLSWTASNLWMNTSRNGVSVIIRHVIKVR